MNKEDRIKIETAILQAYGDDGKELVKKLPKLKEYKGNRALEYAMEKWIRKKGDMWGTGKLGEVFDYNGVQIGKLWASVETITKNICDAKRISQISDIDFANYVANDLCEFIYEYKVKYIEKVNKG